MVAERGKADRPTPVMQYQNHFFDTQIVQKIDQVSGMSLKVIGEVSKIRFFGEPAPDVVRSNATLFRTEAFDDFSIEE